MIPKAVISVIIPVYKVEKYLKRCLDSVINQTLKRIEIICVNDGSPDRCPQILDEYAKRDGRITVIHKENGGLSSARNRGMSSASAPFLSFVDSDDWIESTTLEEAYDVISNDSQIDFVHWGISHYCDETAMIDMERNSKVDEYFYRNPGKYPIEKITGKNIASCAWNKLYKTDIVKQNGILFPHGILYEDISFWMQYKAFAKYGYFLDKCLSNYTVRNDSIMGQTKIKNTGRPLDYLLSAKYTLDYYQRNNLLLPNLPEMTSFFKELVFTGYTTTSDPEAYKNMAISIAKEMGFPNSLCNLLNKRFKKPQEYKRPKYTALERICCIKNDGDKKIFRLLGIELRFKRSL